MGFVCCPICNLSYVSKPQDEQKVLTSENYSVQEKRIAYYENEYYRLQKELDVMIVNSDADLYEELERENPWLVPSDSSSASGTSDDEGSYLAFESSQYAANHRRLLRLIAKCKAKEQEIQQTLAVGKTLKAPWTNDRSWVPPTGTNDRKRIDARIARREVRQKERRLRDTARKTRFGEGKLVHNIHVIAGAVPKKWAKDNPNAPPPPNVDELQRAKKGWVTAEENDNLDEEVLEALKAQRIAEWRATQSPLPKFERPGGKKQRWAKRAYNSNRRLYYLENKISELNAKGSEKEALRLTRLLEKHTRLYQSSDEQFQRLVAKLSSQGATLTAQKILDVYKKTQKIGKDEVAAEKAQQLAIAEEARRIQEEKERKKQALAAAREAREKERNENLETQRRNNISVTLGSPQEGDSSQVVVDGKISVVLTWSAADLNSDPIQCDLSCVALSGEGQLLSELSVYPGRREVAGDGLKLADDLPVCGLYDDKKATIDLKKQNSQVCSIVVLATVADKSFADVADGWQCRLLTNDGSKDDEELFVYTPTPLAEVHTARFLLRIVRNVTGPGWTLSTLNDWDKSCRDFGSLTPEIKSTMLDSVPQIAVNLSERVAYMRQGAVIRVSEYCGGSLTRPLVFCFSWTKASENSLNVNFSSSAICLDENFQLTEGLNVNELTNDSASIVHQGESNQEDEGGDNERITFELANVPATTKYIGLTVSSATGKSLHLLHAVTGRLSLEDTAICHYGLACGEAMKKKTGLLLAVFYRAGADDWQLISAGIPGDGQSSEDLANLTAQYLKERTIVDLGPPRQLKTAKFELLEGGDPLQVAVKVPAGAHNGTKLYCATPHGPVWSYVPGNASPGSTYNIPVHPRPATK